MSPRTRFRPRRLCCLLALLAQLPPGAQALDLSGIGGGNYAIQVSSIKAARFRSTVHQQFDFSCGSAAIATLLSFHYGMPVGEREVFESMFVNGDQARIRREGFSLLDMKRYLAQHGFVADGYQLPLSKLVEAGYPAIVLVAENGYHHFVVIKGIADGRVLLGDPSGGTRAMSQAAFEAIWLSKLLFVIHGWSGRARFNEAAEWRQAPRVALGEAIGRDSLALITLPKHGSGDF
ncbi:C39 family peptidase [Oxalobacteraceae bacterium]|nr:C39 family peptidase [Oxalobacteraceae bacterium]